MQDFFSLGKFLSILKVHGLHHLYFPIVSEWASNGMVAFFCFISQLYHMILKISYFSPLLQTMLAAKNKMWRDSLHTLVNASVTRWESLWVYWCSCLKAIELSSVMRKKQFIRNQGNSGLYSTFSICCFHSLGTISLFWWWKTGTRTYFNELCFRALDCQPSCNLLQVHRI
jgi:hypothetical protein